MEDKEQLAFILSVLKQIPHSETNQWFWDEVLEVKNKNLHHQILSKNDDVDWLVSYFKIDIPRESLFDYSFIQNEKLRNDLKIDNINMVRARYGKLNHQGKVDFEEFIRFAHYQIEGLLNYFFSNLYKKDPDMISQLFIETRSSIKIKKDDEGFYKNDGLKTKDGILVFFKKLMPNHKDKYLEDAKKQVPDFSKYLEFNKLREFFISGFFYEEKNSESVIKKVDIELIKYISWKRNNESHRNVDSVKELKEEDKLKYENFLHKKDFIAIYHTIKHLIEYVKLMI